MATEMEVDHDDNNDTNHNNNNTDTTNSEDIDIDLNSESVQIELAELDSLKPARSGYMLFTKSTRKTIDNCGSVSEQSKRLASLWNALSVEGKQEWNSKVDKQKETYSEYLLNNPSKQKLLELYNIHKKNQKNAQHISFPLGTIKRMILRDPDIKRISKESIVLITESTQLFIDNIVKNISNEINHKTINKNDFINTLHNKSKYMFVRHVFKENSNDNNNNSNNNNNSIREPPKKKAKINNNGSTITQFFNQKK